MQKEKIRIITLAINQRKAIDFKVRDDSWSVNPHRLGVRKISDELVLYASERMRGFSIKEPLKSSKKWHVFLVDEMELIELNDLYFDENSKYYTEVQNDLKEVLAEVEFNYAPR